MNYESGKPDPLHLIYLRAAGEYLSAALVSLILILSCIASANMPPVTILKREGGATGGPSGRGASGWRAPLGAPSTSAGQSKANGLMSGNDGEPSLAAAAVVKGALDRQRRRLEGIYRMRQEAIMRAV